MDLEIDRDGHWVHEGSIIQRIALVKLLASVLRREVDGRYALVTPQERVYIRVQDVPFLIVDCERVVDSNGHQQYALETNLQERVIVSTESPVWIEPGSPSPYASVRSGLAGRFTRAAYYRLSDELVERDSRWGLESGGHFFELG